MTDQVLFRLLFRALFFFALTAAFAAGADAQILAEDFAALTDTTLPAGWTSSKTSDMDYTGEPYVGVAAPSFKFTATGNTLTSPSFATGAAGLQFWAYGNGGAGSTLASKAFPAAPGRRSTPCPSPRTTGPTT
jgi:hypothetical protein